ncbi:hypothetical protein ABE501_18445 [Comamonas testosteroni]
MVDIATGNHLAKDLLEALGLGGLKWVTDFSLKVDEGVLVVHIEKVVLVEQLPPMLRVLQKYRFTPHLESEVEVPPSHKAANLLIPPGIPADLVELLRQSELTEEVEVSAMATNLQSPSP